MAALADKEQPFLGSVLWVDIAAAWACLARVVGVYLHAQRPSQDRFVVEEASQLGKGPFRGVTVGPALRATR